MAIKSLTITEDAYETLKRMKYSDESFSDVILRVGKTQTDIVEKYFGILKRTEKEVSDWEKEIKKSRRAVDAEFVVKQKILQGIRS